MITIPAYAQIKQVHRSTVNRWVNQGMPSVKGMIDPQMADAWLNERGKHTGSRSRKPALRVVSKKDVANATWDATATNATDATEAKGLSAGFALVLIPYDPCGQTYQVALPRRKLIVAASITASLLMLLAASLAIIPAQAIGGLRVTRERDALAVENQQLRADFAEVLEIRERHEEMTALMGEMVPGEAAESLTRENPNVPDPGFTMTAGLRITEAALEERLEQNRVDQARLEYFLTRAVATPNGWPARGYISSQFGWRWASRGTALSRILGIEGPQYHKGIDIVAAHGTPIIATADGEVTYAGWKEGYGQVVFLAHQYSYSTVYAHLSEITVKVGQEVKRGQVIGKMGSTGTSTGTHCHYEVRIGNTPIDPIDFMESEGER